MNIIRPTAITSSVLTASNVEQTLSAIYNSGTSYAVNAKVSVAGVGGLYISYISLQNTNLNHTPSTSPDWWSDIGSLYQAYSAAVTYAINDRVQDNTNHYIYESLVAANLGNALTDSAKWIQVSMTNAWKMFDNVSNSKTIRPYSIEVDLYSTSRINSVALFDVDANIVDVSVTHIVDGLVYSSSTNMVSDSGITDWWSYFYEPIVRKTNLLLLDLPNYADATLSITIDNVLADASCGTCIIGGQKLIGTTDYGASTGIQDYSVKTRNVWGDYTIVERAFNKRAKFNISIENNIIDEIQSLLADYRAVPIVYVGSGLYAATWIYGFYKNFDIVISYFDTSKCSIEIEGLT
jgi:hypothetical protein